MGIIIGRTVYVVLKVFLLMFRVLKRMDEYSD